MAEKLKLLMNEELVRSIASCLHDVHPSMSERSFVQRCMSALDGLELTARAWHIAAVMQEHLPQPFAAAADVLVASLGGELSSTEEFGMSPLRYMPHVFFVQKYGLGDFEAAMRAQYELTKRFSAESSIRAFLVEYPEATLARLREWASDRNPHVRRLVSEGTRPRLPWAPRLRAFQEDPAPVVELLNRLKDDPVRYVQRSVANNLNDIGKDHPDLVVAICTRWADGATPGRTWIIKHATRSLVKQGHRGALRLHGAGDTPKVSILQWRITPTEVRIGSRLQFSVRLANSVKRPQSLLVDYAVHFVKANGATQPKVLKLKAFQLAGSESVELRANVSFQPMTTRRFYPGTHRLELLVNGARFPLGAFQVRA